MRCLKHQLPAIVPRVQGWGIIQMKKMYLSLKTDLSVLLAPVRYLPFTRVCLKVKQRLEIMINGMMLRVEDLKTSCLRRRQERSQASGHGPL
jgi:hypothetical protein